MVSDFSVLKQVFLFHSEMGEGTTSSIQKDHLSPQARTTKEFIKVQDNNNNENGQAWIIFIIKKFVQQNIVSQCW